MIITYLRSSSYGAYSLCEFQYLMQYVLGIPSKPNFKTEKGSIVHKALELLAHRKVCEQEGRLTFFEEEIGQEFEREKVTAQTAIDASWAHYTARNESKHHWPREDYDDCLKWTLQVLEHNNGMFDPLKRKVVCPEQYFDMTIDEPWATYTYKDPHTGKEFTGQLAIKGTVDLLTEVNPFTLEYLDWKSGKRLNWRTFKTKTYEDMRQDPQLLLYFYALTRLYPQYPFIFTTIFFAQDGGPFSVDFERDKHVPFALDMLRRRFMAIKNTSRPKRVWEDPRDRKRICKGFCYYGKTQWQDSGRSICEHVHSEFQELGLDRVTAKLGKPGFFSKYGSGGGSSNRDERASAKVAN